MVNNELDIKNEGKVTIGNRYAKELWDAKWLYSSSSYDYELTGDIPKIFLNTCTKCACYLKLKK